MAKSRETTKMCQKYDFRMEPKITTLLSTCSRSLLCIWFVAVAFRSEEEVSWRRGPPVIYIGHALDQPLDGSGQNALKHVRDLDYFIHTKFHQNPSSGYVAKADYVTMFFYTNTCISAPPLINKKIIKILKAFKSFIQAFSHLQTWNYKKIKVN